MIKFFRNIRRRMLGENRFTKYLLYAIGEIVLVVIGILIALQINNWNSERKARNYERVLLEKIQTDIRRDTIDLNFNLRLHLRAREYESELLNVLRNDTASGEGLNYNMALGTDLLLITHRSAYQNLIEHDISILKDEMLKEELARHYDFFLPAMERIENETPAYDLYMRKAPYFEKHFTVRSNSSDIDLDSLRGTEDPSDFLVTDAARAGMEPTQVEMMKLDNGFKMVLSECIFERGILIDFYKRTVERSIELEKEIQDYLND